MYPKVSVSGICTNVGPCFYHRSDRLLQRPSIWFTFAVHLLKMQRLQNAAARLMPNVPHCSHTTPVLCSLHWLPVKFRFDFKILLAFKPISAPKFGHAPGYLIDLIAIKEQPRYNLRLAGGLILKYPTLKLKNTLGGRAFSSAASNL